jgi:surface antigen
MIKSKLIVIGLASTLALGACTQNGGWQGIGGMGGKQTGGALAGAVGGGILGSNVGGGKGKLIATGAGALLGAFIGSEIGKSLDRADKQYHEQATQQAYTAPIGQTISWTNPETGHSGRVTPVRDGYTANNDYCREYRQTIIVDGRNETATGTACQDEYGEWHLTN